MVFRPLFQTLNQDEGNFGHYFSVRRERRLPSDATRKYGTRTPYVSTEVFVSLVDQHEAPIRENIRYLSVQTLLTNRDLPNLVPRNGLSDLTVADSIPVTNVGLIRPPSAPQAPFAERETAWRLIRQLNINYLPLAQMPQKEAGEALRELLRLFIPNNDAITMQQVQGLIGSDVEATTRRLPGKGPLVYGRGILCKLTVDEDNFSGVSPYLFGLVLEHWLARHVSINVFTQTELHSMQRGRIFQWPPRMGGRSIV
jgi:type VI secretion system protein ImpG